MKKKHLILIALILPLITQMANTANLYKSITNLEGWEKIIGSYFIGLSAEYSIFVCIYVGSRSAGACFAILSFFVGILFHDHWDYFVVDFKNIIRDPMHLTYHKDFLKSTILQFINNLLTWYLAELYVKELKKEGYINEEADISKRIADLRNKEAEESRRVAEVSRILAEKQKEERLLKNSITEGNKEVESLSEQITHLKKQKAGLTPRKEVV